MKTLYCSYASLIVFAASPANGLQHQPNPISTPKFNKNNQEVSSRRDILKKMGLASISSFVVMVGAIGQAPQPAWSAGSATQDSMDVDDFLRRGVDAGGGMGVSSQAGKSRPETGVFLRDGSEVSRNKKTGDLNAEIVVNGNTGEKMAVFVSYSSPWPLAEGPFYDVECRNPKTSDGAFVQVTTNVGGKSIADLDNAFILKNLLAPSGRFSFYGEPTDVRIKKSTTNGEYRIVDFSFSTLSQSTQTELPRKAQLVATIPKGSSQAIMLVGSSPALRWKSKGSDQEVYATIESFRAIAAPKSNLKLRRKERNSFALDENGE